MDGDCDTAVVTITINAVDDAPVANDDSNTTNEDTPVSGSVTGNDTPSGDGGNTYSLVGVNGGAANGTVSLDGAGNYTYTPNANFNGTDTFTYQLCDVDGDCDTAVVTITIVAVTDPIDADDDASGNINGADGGTAIPNILANDSLDGAVPTAGPGGTVVLTVVTPATNPGVVLNTATGAVTVAPGTPAGTYTIVYQICEAADPGNCATATITVTVVAAAIVATDNDVSGTPVNGAEGGVAVPNVLGNDTLNGAAATTSNVTISIVTPASNAGVVLDTATGVVTVAPGTPAGTYTITYQICEVLNPTNCDTAVVTVVVSAPSIVATDNDVSGTPVNGADGGVAVPNVLGNDTLNGAAATTSNVTISIVTPASNAGVVLDTATGVVTVAPGTPAGTYTITYQICEVLNPTNCDNAVVTVVVGASVIEANPDTAPTPINSDTGGTAIPNVLVNDTLNGAPATTANVTISIVTPASNAGVVLNTATGVVTVAPGTPAGTYTITYQICEVLNPTNCDTAVVTVEVVPTDIAPVANDDVTEMTEGDPVSGTVVGNDTAGNGQSTFGLMGPNGGAANGTVTMNPDGSFTYTPNPGFVGTDVFTYQICDEDGDCDTATVTITVLPKANKLRMLKAVNPKNVQIGGLAAYTLTITNVGDQPVVNAQVVDVPPQGFAFVPGSAKIDDVDDQMSVNGIGPVTFSGVDVPIGGTATITYLMKVGAGLPSGTYNNEATIYQSGIAVSNTAAAAVTLESGNDPVFDQTRILGKVFDDQDGDGWQDEGEAGIPGVRLATVEGLVVETDAEGRYHIEGLTVSNAMRGQNFVVKVDESTLPEGSVFTTENPLLRRITPAVPVRFDFGVKLPPQPKREVEKVETQPSQVFSLGTVYFDTDKAEVKPQFLPEIERAAAAIEQHKGGVIRITGYADLRSSEAYNRELALRRAKTVYELIAARLGPEARAGLRVEVEQDEALPGEAR